MVRWTLVLAAVALALGVALPVLAAPPTQLEIAAGAAVKLTVTTDGWYRVGEPQLRAAGLPAGADATALQLFADGVEQALQVTGNGDGVLDPDEAIEFYGRGRDTLWTGARTYWLRVGAAGARVPYVVNPRGVAPAPSFESSVTVRERKLYYAPILNGDASNFLGSTIDGKGATQTLSVGAVADPGTAVLRATLQGVTSGGHVVDVTFGGAAVGSCAYSGQARAVCELAVPAVAAGAAEVRLTATGAAPDISLLESLELTYDHAYTADGDRLSFTAHPRTRVSVAGFSTPDVRVVDVTDPRAPIELVVAPALGVGGWTASFDVQDDHADRALVAFTEAGVRVPVAVAASRPSDWMRPRAGELVILSHARFVEAVRPLAERRAAEGWSVALIDVQDVYDETGAGEKSAFAIRDFLKGAAARWTAPPRYVLLVGDATFDPRDFTGRGELDLVPTKLVDARDMETSSDDWFVDANEDGLPDLPIGRLPVQTAAEAKAVVDKLLAYGGQDELARGGLFVADQAGGGLDFEAASAASAAIVTGRMPVETYGRAAGAAGLLAKLKGGPFLVNYFGHGSVEVWDGLLTGTDAAALDNARPSIYVAMNCLNGFFHDLYTTSLAERLLLAPGGAVAVWASSTLTPFDPQAALNRAFLTRMGRTSLGQAALEAKREITDVDARRTWMLFGDPTLFGTPTPPTPDAGAPADDAGSPSDGGAPDASSPDADPPPRDADSPDAGSPSPDAHVPSPDAVDAGKPSAAAGCSCSTVPTNGGALGGVTLLLALAWLSRGRKRQDARAEEPEEPEGK
jgi:hypothetical protein